MIKIDIEKFQQMLIGGAECISKNFEYIDQLNVFPVPDGDTGTNMCRTIESGVVNIENKNENNHLERSSCYDGRNGFYYRKFQRCTWNES